MKDPFLVILEKEQSDRLIGFLQSLEEDEKKKLAVGLKRLLKEYLEYSAATNYRQKASPGQREILQITSFVCLNRTDYAKTDYALWTLQKKLLQQVIDWYCPDWFNDFVNKTAGLEHVGNVIDYDWVMELTEKGVLQPTGELIVRLLPVVIYPETDRIARYQPENLLKRAVTLEQHFWYLFSHENNIYMADRYLHFGEDKEANPGWIFTIKQVAEQGRIDRQRLLKEALLAGNRNFNKVLSGWFAELFLQLKPTKKELIHLQKELLSVLSCPQSKPVNAVLSCLKKIITEKEFEDGAFLDQVNFLLTSDTKGIVAATLTLLEKLVQKDRGLQLPVCRLATQVFIHADSELQGRAAKIIDQYRSVLDASFPELLMPYQSTILSPARTLLGSLLALPSVESETPDPVLSPPLVSYSEIPRITTADDLVFLASQAFDNNEPWHTEQFIASLIQWQGRLKGEQMAMLEPALQRALKLIDTGMQAGQGCLDKMLAIFFIDVCIYFIRRYPREAAVLNQLFKMFGNKSRNITGSWMAINAEASYTAKWDRSEASFYYPYHQLIMAALEKIRKGDELPLISTPTHQPAWLDPVVLVQRLAVYQQKRRDPIPVDLEMAVSRCLPGDKDKAISLAEELLTGEYRNLLLFLFGKDKEPRGPFDHESVWTCASLTFKERRETPDLEKPEPGQKPFARLVKLFAKKKAPPILYGRFHFKHLQFGEHNDIRRLLQLTPYNPEPLLAAVMSQCLKDSNFWEEADRKITVATIQALYEIWDDWGKIAYAFLGASMLSQDKTILHTAGEIWLAAVPAGKMNAEQLGKEIGLLESVEFAPLKRLTDLMTQRLIHVSALHDKQLQICVLAIMKELPEKPVNNLKKLLEIGGELTITNGEPVRDPAIILKLQHWRNNSNLQKMVSRLTPPKN